jgi:formylglycine-generating enzyme required for sulfatase activity
MNDKNNHIFAPASSEKNGSIKPSAFTPVTAKDLKKKKRIRITTILTGSFLLICFVVIWFVFTAKSLYIETNPEYANTTLTRGLRVKLADRYMIRPGNYQASIDALGYYPIDAQITVTDEQNQRLPFELRRLPGHLKVITTPVVEAEIWLNDELAGESNRLINNLPHATYDIKIITERYLPFEGSLDIEGLDKEQSMEVELTPAWAEISVTSVPAVADIFIDDELIGTTPIVAEVMQGAHNIRIKLAGFKAWQDDIKVNANEAMTIEEISLVPADALISLQSRPSQASVTLNGEYRGLTPLEIALTPGESVDIRFLKQGYFTESKRVTAVSGDEKQLLVNLKPELTSVKISSTPADAELYIDGILRGRAVQDLEMPTRPHKILIKRDGYISYESTITPRIGIDQHVKVSLKTLRQAKLDAIKPVITSSAGQNLKLFYPGKFTMGASRREAGRRANESLRNIELTKPFYLSIKEVSNAEFRLFASKHSSGETKGNDLDNDLQPAVNIRWEQAALYCNWLSKQEKLEPFYIEENSRIIGFNESSFGYRLPTEAEWAWAARVTGNQQLVKFPWGDVMPPAKDSGNFADDAAAHLLGRVIPNYDDGYATSSPVGRFQPNSKGLYDLGGNVSEWIHDYYDIAVGRSHMLETDPLGATKGDHHVIRGSSWAHGSITELRYSWRNYGSDPMDDIGFRIARYLDL